MFAGLTVSQTSSNSPKTTPTISSMRKINFSSNNQPSSNTPQMKQQSLGTWDVPSISSIDSMGEATQASTGSHTRTRIGNRSPVMETGLLQPNHGWSSGISTESTSRIGMKPLDSGSGQPTEWSSSSINKPTPGLGMEPLDMRTGLLQPLTTSDWSNSSMPNSSKQLPSKPDNGWSNNEQQGMGGILQPSSGWLNNNGQQPSQGMGILQPSSGSINQSPSMGMGNIQPQSMGIGNTQPQGMGMENTRSSSMGTGQLQPTAVSGWSRESGSNFGTGRSQHPAGGWSNSINQSSNISGMGTISQPQSMGMETSQPWGMGMGTSQPQSMGMGTSQPQSMGMGTSHPQSMGMGTSHPLSMGMGTSNPQNVGMWTSQPQSGMGMQTSQPQNMGMGTAQSHSMGMGTNQSQSRGNNQQFGTTASDWSSNIGGWSNNTTSQLLPTPATRPQTTPLYKDQSQPGIAPGPNPFADFNF